MSPFLIRQLHTLDTFIFSFAELNKAWECDKRYGMDALQRFLFLNHRAFDYLNVKADIVLTGNDPYLQLTTVQYAGSVPTLSPKDGKPCGDLCIGGRFGEDISELLSVVGDTLLPQYDDSLPPLSSSMLEPPLYFECCNFIDKWFEVERAHWHKFDVTERVEHVPTGGTRWDVYASRCYAPQNMLLFQSRSNALKPLHREMCQLLSVLFTCFREIKRPQTPMRSRISYSSKIDRLQAKYSESFTLQTPDEFVEHASDPIAVKEAKRLANIIIQNKRTNKRAWRIDYSEFFERYVQFIFTDVANKVTARAICNPHYSVSGNRPTWVLHYLEPDIIVQKDEVQYAIDAKYKSHIFNRNDYSDELKDTFRHDFHQILAYCAFNGMQIKKAMLVYPFSDFYCHKLRVSSPLTHTDADIYLLGIPLSKNKLEDTKDRLTEIMTI